MIDKYDLEKLKQAERLIEQVYDYNYGDNDRFVKRLTTVIKKLDYIIENEKE